MQASRPTFELWPSPNAVVRLRPSSSSPQRRFCASCGASSYFRRDQLFTVRGNVGRRGTRHSCIQECLGHDSRNRQRVGKISQHPTTDAKGLSLPLSSFSFIYSELRFNYSGGFVLGLHTRTLSAELKCYRVPYLTYFNGSNAWLRISSYS